MLSSAPAWWFESWQLRDWVQTFLDQSIEVSAVGLGVLVGVCLALITARGRPGISTVLALASVSLALGGPGAGLLCMAVPAPCRLLRLKPWYFLFGVAGARLLTIRLTEVVSETDVDASSLSWPWYS